MPSALTVALQDHLAGEVTTLCTLWSITRKDGAVFRYTDHDRDITFGGNLFKSGIGYDRSALEDKADMSVDNIDIKGILSASDISREDVRAGLFDGAEVRVRIVNWADPDAGAIIKRAGWFGNVKQNNRGEFDTELRGLSQALTEALTGPYTPGCTVDLGSTGVGKCNKDLAALAKAFEVVSVVNRQTFEVALSQPLLASDPSYYNGGVMKFDYGGNDSVAREMKTFSPIGTTGGNVTLFLRAPFEIQVGDTGVLYPGCNKSLRTCVDRFQNGVNYQGFPHVPGDSYVKDYPDRR